jgi:hypothetical protein
LAAHETPQGMLEAIDHTRMLPKGIFAQLSRCALRASGKRGCGKNKDWNKGQAGVRKPSAGICDRLSDGAAICESAPPASPSNQELMEIVPGIS